MAGREPASGHVKSQRQLIRRAYLGEQRFQRVPQVGNRDFCRRTITYRPDARAQLCRGAPDAVFVLFDDVRHMDYAGHDADSPTPGAWHGSARRVVLGQPQNRRRAAAGLVHGLSSQTGSASRTCRRRSPGPSKLRKRINSILPKGSGRL